MGVVADRWLSEYRQNIDAYREVAAEVEDQIRVALKGYPFEIHTVESRAKNPDSAAEKIYRKGYGRPAQQMTDVIGIRIITLFDHTIEQVAKRVKSAFTWDESASVDKTQELAHGKVGYRSVHVVIHPRATGLGTVNKILRSTVVEVQIRSVISHAWAEIEHSIRYKAGESVPKEIRRRFDALAGALELVDREFSSISKSLSTHVEALAVRLQSGLGLDDRLDTLELLASVGVTHPDIERQGPDGLYLPIEEAHRFASALRTAGVLTAGDLIVDLSRSEVHEHARHITGNQDLESQTTSAAVWFGAVLLYRSPSLLKMFSRFDDVEFANG